MAEKDRGQFRIGTSGYQYDHWKGDFYPEDLPRSQWLDFYMDHFDTVEINNSFYHLPSAETFRKWHDQAKPGFRYTLKFSRYGSHLKKLKDPDNSIGNFLEAAEHLKSYMGAILVQLPPNWGANVRRLAAFLDRAPRRHRWALEFRDPDWLCEEVFEVMAENNAALVVHDMIDDHPRRTTADWVYLRYHGKDYSGNFSDEFLQGQAEIVQQHLGQGRDVYAYFNNDIGGHAIRNARTLRRLTTGN
ncbi:MAG: DUF72 domain-containing protein [Phycisphaerae bacterium]